jgi:Gluconate 2-dehydrogenase subunit 3
MKISRRACLKGFGAAMVLGLFGAGLAWRQVGPPRLADLTGWTGFSSDDVSLLNEIADSIIPATDTPGAKAADVGVFIAAAVTDCYDPQYQAAFVAGLRAVELACLGRYGRGFQALTAAERTVLLSEIDGERKWRELWNRGERGLRILARPLVGWMPAPVQTPHYFTMMRDLAVLGYFTSLIGATQALRHSAIPGDYNGALAYRKGDRAWSM